MTFSAVEKPGAKMRAKISCLGQGGVRLDQAAFTRLGQDAVPVQAFAVILDRDDDAAALMGGGKTNRPERGFSLGHAFRGQFDAVVNRVADHVDERVAQLLYDVAIQFRLFAFHDKLHLLLLLRGEVAHEARHFLKGPADRHHAQRHGGALQFGGDPAELTQAPRQMTTRQPLHVGVLDDHGLGNDQFPHQVHQAVQLPGIELHESRGAFRLR